MRRRTTRRMMAFLTLATLGVAWACASATREGTPDDPLIATLNRLKEREAAQAVGSVSGHLFFLGPDAVSRFTNAPVSLIPLSPDLEAAITSAHQEYLAGRRAPLAPQVAQARGALLDGYIAEIPRRGFGAFARTTTTDEKDARFEFEAVPEGRWLLVAGVASRASVLYWAVPVEIRAGTALRQNLSESNFWIEGLK